VQSRWRSREGGRVATSGEQREGERPKSSSEQRAERESSGWQARERVIEIESLSGKWERK
jgi:hypothetical protein